MKFCKDCKYSMPNKEEWGTEPYQSKYRICTISQSDPVNGKAECSVERARVLFSSRCGPNAKYFESAKGGNDG